MSFLVPYNHGSLQLVYNVDFNFVGLTPDKTEIVFLTELEYLKCTKPGVTFCHLTSPFRFVSKINSSCVTTLLTLGSVQHCPTIVQPSDVVFPQIKLLANGKWAVMSDEPLHFTVLCKNNRATKYINTDTPIDLISLPLGCHAKSQTVEIPPTYYQASHMKVQHIVEFAQRNISHLDLIPHDLQHAPLTVPHLLNEIVDSPISIDSLQSHLNEFQNQQLPPFKLTSNPWLIAVIVCLLILSAVVAALFIWFKCFRNNVSTTSRNNSSTPPPPYEDDLSDLHSMHEIQPGHSRAEPVTSSLFSSLAAGADALHSPVVP